MSKTFTTEQVRSLMNQTDNIRNMSIIAHVDHGKTTLTDSLIAACGIIRMNQAGTVCLTDTMELEKQKGITIKSTGISLVFDIDNLTSDSSKESSSASSSSSPENQSKYLVNLVDCPGHVDFSSEVTAALRVTDGALVVVDCVESVCVQTETVLRQALAERIRPVLCINKLDRAFLELQKEPEEIYQMLYRTIEKVNNVIDVYQDEALGEIILSPELGNVAFAAAKQAWGFNLRTFARIYSVKLGINEDKLVQKLWGENYYDPESKSWTTSATSPSGKRLKRAFCQFIIEPIKKVFDSCMDKKPFDEIQALMSKVGVKLPPEDADKTDKILLKACMQTWLPAHEGLLEMIVRHLPSPKVAQRYRTELLYEGPMDDEAAVAMKNCDPKGPLMLYISKLVQQPGANSNRFFAFGRVFSGTVGSNKVRVITGLNYTPGDKEGVYIKTIQRTLIMMGKHTDSVEDVPCGNTVALVGIDDVIVKTATVTSVQTAYPIKQMKYSVSPVVRVAVSPKNASELLKLVEGLKRFAKSDPLVQVTHDETTGQHILAGAGELHLEICISELQRIAGIEIVVSTPVVSFKETVTERSSIVCLSKSQNKHNRLFCVAEPLGEELAIAIEKSDVSSNQEVNTRAKILSGTYNWDPDEAKKIWCFGPDVTGPNMLVNTTRGQQNMNEIKDHCVAAFQWASGSGVLCDESMRGCRFNMVDVVLHPDSIHRGGGQILPTARRVILAGQLTAQPRLQEPIFCVDIQCPVGAVVNSVYSVLNQRRGYIVQDLPVTGTNITNIKAHMPVAESFGFTAALRQATSGQAFPQLAFDHWSTLNGSPFEDAKVKEIVADIRKRKGLAPEIPALDKLTDKL